MKLPLRELVEGRYFKPEEKFEPGFVVTAHSFKVFKANIWGNVVRKYVNDAGSFAVIELDDFSDVMQLHFFRDSVPLVEGINEGMRVEAIGRLRPDRNGEIALVPELIQEISPEKELVKRLENLKSLKELKPLSEKELSELKEKTSEVKREALEEKEGEEELVVEKNFVGLDESKELDEFKNKLEDLL